MRRTHSSDKVAASRNPRARSIAVRLAVMLFEIVKIGGVTDIGRRIPRPPVAPSEVEGPR